MFNFFHAFHLNFSYLATQLIHINNFKEISLSFVHYFNKNCQHLHKWQEYPDNQVVYRYIDSTAFGNIKEKVYIIFISKPLDFSKFISTTKTLSKYTNVDVILVSLMCQKKKKKFLVIKNEYAREQIIALSRP